MVSDDKLSFVNLLFTGQINKFVKKTLMVLIPLIHIILQKNALLPTATTALAIRLTRVETS